MVWFWCFRGANRPSSITEFFSLDGIRGRFDSKIRSRYDRRSLAQVGRMKVKVVFFAPFRELFGEGEREVGLNDSPRVKELLDLLCDSEERRDKLFDQSGELRAYVMILKNGQPISTLSGVQTALEDGDEIAVFPPVTGG